MTLQTTGRASPSPAAMLLPPCPGPFGPTTPTLVLRVCHRPHGGRIGSHASPPQSPLNDRHTRPGNGSAGGAGDGRAARTPIPPPPDREPVIYDASGRPISQ
jgi:hypothetical protein